MSLTPEQIERLAKLSRLGLSDAEKASMQTELNAFFEIAAQISSVDTTGIEPMAHPIEIIQAMNLRLAKDEAIEEVDREMNQRSSPSIEDGLYVVPKVIE